MKVTKRIRHDAKSLYRLCLVDGVLDTANSAALLDVSPLFKYEIEGKDAGRLLVELHNRSTVRRGVVAGHDPLVAERFGTLTDPPDVITIQG